MLLLIIQRINGAARGLLSRRCLPGLVIGAVFAMMLTAFAPGRCFGQLKPAMKIKVSVLPSINIARMDVDLQSLFAEDINHINELASVKNAGEDPITLEFGFSISAYENINVLLSYTRPEVSDKDNHSVYPLRMVCGYINDGTRFFKRAIITNSSSVLFRLRNNNLLKRSMRHTDPLFVAYTFFLVNHLKGISKEDGPLPISTITIEYM